MQPAIRNNLYFFYLIVIQAPFCCSSALTFKIKSIHYSAEVGKKKKWPNEICFSCTLFLASSCASDMRLPLILLRLEEKTRNSQNAKLLSSLKPRPLFPGSALLSISLVCWGRFEGNDLKASKAATWMRALQITDKTDFCAVFIRQRWTILSGKWLTPV